jgi:peptidoglycan/LPS O-acetylase OafA/YrhL
MNQSKTTSGAPKLTGVDGVRAVAMLMVFAFHVWEFSGHPDCVAGSFRFGEIIGRFALGVDLFIVLSGFCLYWPMANTNKSFDVKQYFQRRFWRIAPAYYMSILLMLFMPNALVVLMKLLHKPATWQEVPGLVQVLTHLTFTHALHPETWGGIQGAYWSLGLEAQLYVAFPLVLITVRRFGVPITALFMWLVTIAWSYICPSIFPNAEFAASLSIFGRWGHFAAGMLVAHFCRGAKRQNHWALGALGLLIVVLGQLDSVASFSLLPATDFCSLAGFGLILMSAVQPEGVRTLFSSKPLVYLGTISYSIFLLHQNIMWYFGELLKKIANVPESLMFPIYMTIGFGMIVILASYWYRWFEVRFAKGWPAAFAKAEKSSP